jgi:hypothetical protein
VGGAEGVERSNRDRCSDPFLYPRVFAPEGPWTVATGEAQQNPWNRAPFGLPPQGRRSRDGHVRADSASHGLQCRASRLPMILPSAPSSSSAPFGGGRVSACIHGCAVASPVATVRRPVGAGITEELPHYRTRAPSGARPHERVHHTWRTLLGSVHSPRRGIGR